MGLKVCKKVALFPSLLIKVSLHFTSNRLEEIKAVITQCPSKIWQKQVKADFFYFFMQQKILFELQFGKIPFMCLNVTMSNTYNDFNSELFSCIILTQSNTERFNPAARPVAYHLWSTYI